MIRTLRRGLSLIEFLVVIAIFAVLIALILPAIQSVRESARRAECMNRLKNLGMATLNSESQRGYLPPSVAWGPLPSFGIPDGAGHGMWSFLLSYLDQDSVAKQYRFDVSYDHVSNQPAATARIAVLMCPNLDSQRIEKWEAESFGGVADYAPLEVNPFLADIGLIDPVTNFTAALSANATTQLSDISDGTSNTILLVEAAGRTGIAWSSPLVPVGLRQVVGGSAGPHRNGTPVCFADGSVRFIPNTIDLRILGRMATRAGGEAVDVSGY